MQKARKVVQKMQLALYDYPQKFELEIKPYITLHKVLTSRKTTLYHCLIVSTERNW